uniref:Putative secreted protein n=1 Tax=Anopheles darlingi TaxID=43151 RepID=A0A2M4D5L1_ANODA
MNSIILLCKSLRRWLTAVRRSRQSVALMLVGLLCAPVVAGFLFFYNPVPIGCPTQPAFFDGCSSIYF